MRHSMGDDYFSFMSAKGDKNLDGQSEQPASRPKSAISKPALPDIEATLPQSVMPTDIVDYVEEPTIEVTESFVSDTTIQRIFKQFAAPDGVSVATTDTGSAGARR